MRPYALPVLAALLAAGCADDHKAKSFAESLALENRISGPVLNEILFDPLQEPGDSIPDQPDFVEIYNPGITALDLTGWSIADRPSPTTGKANRYYFAPKGGNNMLGPGQYGVITPESNGLVGGSRLTTYYSYLQGTPDARIFIVKNYKVFSLNNDGDCVKLIDNKGAVADSANYTPNWHNPGNKSTKQLSIEKFHPLMPSDSPLSWTSSTDSQYGATPGKANSVYVAPTRAEEIFTLSPNPFSPNGDRRDDVLKISVSLPAGSYQLAVALYDATGRKVRSLASGTPVGPATVLTWDGRDDAGQLQPAGTYRATMNAAGYSGSRYSGSGTVVLAR
ncbi:MAG TPA: lamin tail domain-containing protein [Chlorobaculum sp.]|nr:lamin tail domain-containing protein [Chlorobaculum sp.]